MRITIWGARGSVPVAGQVFVHHGGSTTCIEVQTDTGECIIIDAGTGIRILGSELGATPREKRSCALLLTHAHWDHLQGLPHFAPIFDPTWTINVYGAADMGQSGVDVTLRALFNGRNFPLNLDQTACTLNIHDFKPGESFHIGKALVETHATRHPGGNTAYKITADGWSFVFTGDHESGFNHEDPTNKALAEFIRGADVLIADGQFTAEEYDQYKGWGHSPMEFWPELATKAGVKRLILTHHKPERTDDDFERLRESLIQRFGKSGLIIEFAKEGLPFSRWDETLPKPQHDPVSWWLCEFSRELSQYTDVGMLLDRILSEARRLGNADAGTVYLEEDGKLIFAYTHNDTLFPGALANKHVYAQASLPIDQKSIAGWVAHCKESLNIANVRELPLDSPYGFNDSFDRATGYRTVSVLSAPLMGRGEKVLGVLQIINAQSAHGVIPFTPDVESRLNLLCTMAVQCLERGLMAKNLIMRMLQTVALRDPGETAGHVARVGSCAAEIYHRIAEKQGMDIDALRSGKDNIRLAAMLHDMGKVGIPDAILKKPGRLEPDERAVMEHHCALGAGLFAEVDWDMDAMVQSIALHHHQKWDGTGYTGSPDQPVLAGQTIPLAARITAVADVFDALVSKRCYKPSWTQDDAVAEIQKSAGTHFDPEVVDAFLEIREIIDAIYSRYPG